MSSSGISAHLSTRERIITGAAHLTARFGWAQVTMARIGEHVGVSRQTVYNEFGSRSELAEAVVLHELSAFLAEVDAGFEAYPDDVGAGLVAAAHGVLELAKTNPLLAEIVTATHGGSTELLPLLTTRADAVIEAASLTVGRHVRTYDLDPAAPVDAVVDLIVRSVLSHVMQPGDAQSGEGSIEKAIAWLALTLTSRQVGEVC